MIKILIYVAGRDTHNLNPALNKFVKLYPKVNVQIVGSTGIKPLKFSNNVEVNFIPFDKIADFEFDFVVVTGGSDDINGIAPQVHFGDIVKSLRLLNIPEDKIILDRVLCIPNFTFEKYDKLKKSRPTIFAMNCFGGVLYHRFGLPFYSPTINMWLTDDDMIKFLRNPIKNIESEIQFDEWKNETPGMGDYPAFRINTGGDDIILHMNHYGRLGVDFAKKKWDERKQRINWFNVIPCICTENPNVLEEFDAMPFAKKICFVNFKSDKDSAFYLNPILDGNKSLGDLVNRFGLGYNQYNYDLWDMLLYGKKSYY